MKELILKMKRILFILLTFTLTHFFLNACEGPPLQSAAPAAPPADVAPQGVIVCMGNSLTAGYGVDEDKAYPALLESRLREAGYSYTVINAGVSGETSSGALSRLDWMLTLAPDIVILETGANDGLRGVDPALTRRNIKAIVSELQARGIVVVLAGMQMVRNLGPDYTRSFGAIYPDIAESSGVILMPFFLEGVAGRPGLNQADGIHPTAEGYRRITANLYPYVLEAIRQHQERPSR
jgi:acyl-CoA thioesterase-1